MKVLLGLELYIELKYKFTWWVTLMISVYFLHISGNESALIIFLAGLSDISL